MTLLTSLTQDINTYLAKHPHERGGLTALISGLDDRPDALWNRKAMEGHLTATAIVLDNQAQQVLMIHHKALDRWLAPGGHVDPGEMPSQAALRELEEETGLQAHLVCQDPIDIDVHVIPPRPSKEEGEHFHFDFRYEMRAASMEVAILQASEIAQAEWQALDVLKQAYPRVHQKLSALKSSKSDFDPLVLQES